jgi:hypothetical protein
LHLTKVAIDVMLIVSGGQANRGGRMAALGVQRVAADHPRSAVHGKVRSLPLDQRLQLRLPRRLRPEHHQRLRLRRIQDWAHPHSGPNSVSFERLKQRSIKNSNYL